MPTIRFTQSLQQEYEDLYANCEVRANRFDEVDRVVDSILSNKSRYPACCMKGSGIRA